MSYYTYTEDTERRIAELEAELEKRDKGIARLRRQRDYARNERDELKALLSDARTLPSIQEINEARAEAEHWRKAFGKVMDGLHELNRYGEIEVCEW